jgi:hypothetical protein
LIDHSRVVPTNSQASNKDLFGIISLMVSTISKHSTRHQFCSSSELWNFTNNLSNHSSIIQVLSSSFAG